MSTRTSKQNNEKGDFQRVYRQVRNPGAVSRLEQIQCRAKNQTSEESWPGECTNEFAEAKFLCMRQGGEPLARQYFGLIRQYYGGRGFVAEDLAAVC